MRIHWALQGPLLYLGSTFFMLPMWASLLSDRPWWHSAFFWCVGLFFAFLIYSPRPMPRQVKGRAPGSSDQRPTDPANGSTGEAHP